jgi:hypothetical protein
MSELLVPHVEPVLRASTVRSTLLQQSLKGLKLHGLYDRWCDQIEQSDRQRIVEAIAPEWLPIELGLAHYEACDRLDVDDDLLGIIGEGTGQRVQSTLLATSAKLAQTVGMTSSVAAHSFSRIWPRLFQGGSIEFVKVGPKDSRLEVRAAVLSRSRYFRAALCGNLRAAFKLVAGARVAYTKAQPYDASRDRFVVVLSWV